MPQAASKFHCCLIWKVTMLHLLEKFNYNLHWIAAAATMPVFWCASNKKSRLFVWHSCVMFVQKASWLATNWTVTKLKTTGQNDCHENLKLLLHQQTSWPGDHLMTKLTDYSVVLLVVAIIVCITVVLFNIYLLINYQHPDDYNQAYLPKIIVIFGLSVSQISILMLPADVANTKACQNSVYLMACNYTLPMKQLWYAVYIIITIFVFVICPFAFFYYEADSDK